MSDAEQPARTGYWVSDAHLAQAQRAREVAARFPRDSETAETLLSHAVQDEAIAASLYEDYVHRNAVAEAMFGWSR